MLDKKHFAKGARGSEKNGVAAAPQDGNLKEIALMEAKMNKLCDLLDEVSKRCFIISLSVVPLMIWNATFWAYKWLYL